MRTAGDVAGGADAVIDTFRALLAADDGRLTDRGRVARAARDAAIAIHSSPRQDRTGGLESTLALEP